MLSVHCFNYYGKNKDKKCPDLEVRYYIECNGKINNSRKRRSPIVCRTEAPYTDDSTTPAGNDETTTINAEEQEAAKGELS